MITCKAWHSHKLIKIYFKEKCKCKIEKVVQKGKVSS